MRSPASPPPSARRARCSISAASRRSTQHKMGSLQDLPHVEMMQPITKFAAGVFSTERVADMIAMAAREAFAGAPGPAYLEIPRDVLDREIAFDKAVIPSPAITAPRPARSATRATSRSSPTSWSRRSGRPFSTASRCGRRAARTRRSRCSAASTFRAISTAPRAGCCRRAIPIISTGRDRLPSPRRM